MSVQLATMNAHAMDWLVATLSALMNLDSTPVSAQMDLHSTEMAELVEILMSVQLVSTPARVTLLIHPLVALPSVPTQMDRTSVAAMLVTGSALILSHA